MVGGEWWQLWPRLREHRRTAAQPQAAARPVLEPAPRRPLPRPHLRSSGVVSVSRRRAIQGYAAPSTLYSGSEARAMPCRVAGRTCGSEGVRQGRVGGQRCVLGATGQGQVCCFGGGVVQCSERRDG